MPTKDEVRAARLAAGLTQKQAADRCGLSNRERFAEYESGVRTMPEWRWVNFLKEADIRYSRNANEVLPSPSGES